MSTPTSMSQTVKELEAHGHLLRITDEVDANLQVAEIQRRAYLAGAPALLFENIKGCSFPGLANLYGTMDRCHFIFRKTIQQVQRAVSIKADPPAFVKEVLKNGRKNPGPYLKMPFTGIHALPKKVSPSRAPVLEHQTSISKLPLIKSWPDDGGAFITLPQVCSLDPNNPTPMKANLGMYRVQLDGNDYQLDKEIGVHYQIHRGIGIHHTAALAKNQPLRVSIFVGGPPAHTFAAVMPLPEGLSELMFAGMLSGRRFRYAYQNNHFISAEADFCIVGTIGEETKPEGPFGDHLGYYSLAHEFPMMKVEAVYHRKDAIWPFTVVGRPPQEDTTFGKMIHEITVPMVPVSLPGVDSLHAVDAAGVHPLLLAIGSERYTPYQKDCGPQELLTQANAILGFNQCSLAKFLFIVSRNDAPNLDIDHIPDFLDHLLERVDLSRDLHFQTRTTIDTLDYSGTGLNQGSKLVIAACGKPIRKLKNDCPSLQIPEPFRDLRIARPGILLLKAPPFQTHQQAAKEIGLLCQALENQNLDGFPMIVLCNDAEFASRTLNNFLWQTFTRANPSHDCYGVRSFTEHKHWGCLGPLVIDSRTKGHHAPPLIEDPAITKAVDDLCYKNKELGKVLS